MFTRENEAESRNKLKIIISYPQVLTPVNTIAYLFPLLSFA